ncbi:predicted protein [Nematostella vectensis]|uniref:Pinin n=1 Tax=Nematostella vectensis TaxID=45351 RepID=A7RWZ2_NEMVE|nr:pinin [Nematostella vectensis]EDO44058.1 predicted protein [Nematostella vectensis]|eukprot:XP_001636121.1 predicted protein [Nematostella vectensis]
MATVAELRREVEIAREGLKNVDETIKKLTGRDPSEFRPPGRRVSLKRDFGDRSGLHGPGGKRRVSGDDQSGPRGRLSSRVIVSQTSQVSARHSLDSDGEEEEDDSKKPSIQSSVVATAAPVRLKREPVIADDAKTKSRNRRMFGMLLGTLQKFKQDSVSHSDKEKRREEINKKLEEKEAKEKEEMATQRRDLYNARRAKQAELKRLEWKVELTAMQEEWDQNSLHLCNSIKTKATPPIFYLPSKHTDKTQKLLEESSRAVKRAMAKRRAEIEEELEKEAERIKATQGEGGTIGGEGGEDPKGGGEMDTSVNEQEEVRENDHVAASSDTRQVIVTEDDPMDAEGME